MKILILTNSDIGLWKFRKELLEELINRRFEIHVSLPKGKYIEQLRQLGCNIMLTNVNRRGTNPIKDLKLFISYIRTIKAINPKIVLTYTIKPNIYGGFACRITNHFCIPNITGLGTSIQRKGLIKYFVIKLYKLGLKKSKLIFFQNKMNKDFFDKNSIIKSPYRILPGSGVNLEEHKFEKYPKEEKKIRFLFVGRIMQEKGISELLNAAAEIKKSYPDTEFEIVGDCEEDYSEKLKSLDNNGIIRYYGEQQNIHEFIKNSHVLVLPSYHEGMSNVLLEATSSGRPVLASNISGCTEIFDEGISGFGFEVKNTDSLVKAIERFIELPYKKKIEMGLASRKKTEASFSRQIVVDAYIDQIDKISYMNEINN